MKHHFKNLEIWKKARKLVKKVYQLTANFPKQEIYGLSQQMRRAAVSIPSNIAEGCGRNGDKELIQFLHIAIGSICELETQLYLSFDLSYISQKEGKELAEECSEIRKMTTGFIKIIKTKSEKPDI